ncbi:alpha-1,3-rhamnosyltransferase [Pedobacter jeongneungensis]|uniref:Alpha-1,3-rhamnosyltransferase n=1 Tax=Pedobacter jeongneungensis TaxID=947309 RepID=A0ABP8BEN1_9SPHI
MNNLPLVSVIIPCYNHQDFIEACLESVVNQTYKNIEVIVIDDGSKDETPRILQKLANKYTFSLEIQKNLGLSKTLNKAIRKYAGGKYISIIASDDYWELNKISKQVDFLENSENYALVFGKAKIVDNNNVFLGNLGDDMNEELSFETLLFDNKIIASTTMFKRDIWEKVGGFNEDSYIEDWDLWLKMAENYKIGFINENLGFYRRHGSNMSNNLLRMENAKTNIVKQWSAKDQYPLAIKLHILSKANILAPKFKKETMTLLWENKNYFFSVRYLTACIRLLFFW